MDKILEIKDSFMSSAPNDDEINQIFQTFKTHAEKICQEEYEEFTEEERKIQELENKIQEQQDYFFIEEQKLKGLVNDLSNHNEALTELESEWSKLLAENYENETAQGNMSLKLMKPNLGDQQLLDNGRKTLDYYKVLTGVRWDYPMLKTSIKGYVTNNEDYVHPFNFDIDDDSLESKLWKEIEKCTETLGNVQSEHKENSDPN